VKREKVDSCVISMYPYLNQSRFSHVHVLRAQIRFSKHLSHTSESCSFSCFEVFDSFSSFHFTLLGTATPRFAVFPSSVQHSHLSLAWLKF